MRVVLGKRMHHVAVWRCPRISSVQDTLSIRSSLLRANNSKPNWSCNRFALWAQQGESSDLSTCLVRHMSTMSAQRLSNLTAVVTGSSSGIGRAIALGLAGEGAALVVCADLRPDQSQINSTPPLGAHAASLGRDLAVKALDVAQSNMVDQEIPTHTLIRKRFGPDKAVYVPCDVALEDAASDDAVKGIRHAIEKAVELTGKLDL